MKKIKVDVNKVGGYYRERYYVDCSLGPGKGRETLFEFWPSFSGWAFDTKAVLGWHGGLWDGTDITGSEFPLDYFKRLCQSVWILKTHDTEFPEIELTVGAKKLLDIQ